MSATEHSLKVVPPYFDALCSGAKTFEVRKNDRAYQAGDVLVLREWHPTPVRSFDHCTEGAGCEHYGRSYGHWSTTGIEIRRRVTFVYSGDPRFGGVEPGCVVLALGEASHPSPAGAGGHP